jgi:pyruvate/2-oxoglutarate dehydrogenase complex dihydrolipoamide dehydrogenase (E3) component
MAAVQARKKRIIADFARYRVDALEGGPFDLYRAQARFLDPHSVELSDGRRLRGRHFLHRHRLQGQHPARAPA